MEFIVFLISIAVAVFSWGLWKDVRKRQVLFEEYMKEEFESLKTEVNTIEVIDDQVRKVIRSINQSELSSLMDRVSLLERRDPEFMDRLPGGKLYKDKDADRLLIEKLQKNVQTLMDTFKSYEGDFDFHAKTQIRRTTEFGQLCRDTSVRVTDLEKKVNRTE